MNLYTYSQPGPYRYFYKCKANYELLYIPHEVVHCTVDHIVAYSIFVIFKSIYVKDLA